MCVCLLVCVSGCYVLSSSSYPESVKALSRELLVARESRFSQGLRRTTPITIQRMPRGRGALGKVEELYTHPSPRGRGALGKVEELYTHPSLTHTRITVQDLQESKFLFSVFHFLSYSNRNESV